MYSVARSVLVVLLAIAMLQGTAEPLAAQRRVQNFGGQYRGNTGNSGGNTGGFTSRSGSRSTSFSQMFGPDYVRPSKPSNNFGGYTPNGNFSGGYGSSFNPYTPPKPNVGTQIMSALPGIISNLAPQPNGYFNGNDGNRGGGSNWGTGNYGNGNNGGKKYYYPSKNNPPTYSNQPQYTQPKYGSQPTYTVSPSAPSNTVTTSSKPVVKNAVPKNSVPQKPDSRALLANHQNSLPLTNIQDLPPNMGERLSGELNGQLKQDFENVRDELNQATDSQVAQVLDIVDNSTTLSPDEAADIRRALEEGNLPLAENLLGQSIEKAIANGDGPQVGLMQAKQQVGALSNIHGTLADIENALQQGASAAQLDPMLQDYRNALGALNDPLQNAFFPTTPATEQFIQNSLAGLENIQRNLAIEESMLAGPAGPQVPSLWSLLSPQPLYVMYDPGIPPHVYYQGGPDLIVMNSPTGEFYTDQAPIAEVMQLPIGIGSPAPMPGATATVSRFVILNPDPDAPTINFLLGGKSYSVEQGQTLEIKQRGPRVVRYDDGQDHTVEYSIKPGAYNFRVEDGKLTFYHLPIRVRIHNDNPNGEFHLLVDGRVESIPPGESLRIKSDFPPVVEFDQGDGREPVKRRLTEKKYTVAINPKADSWDLFASASIAGQAPPEALVNDHPKPARKPRW